MDRELNPAPTSASRPARSAASPGPGEPYPAGTSSSERGFSLVEAMVAAAIAVLAVMGMAYTFGVGRGQVSRFEEARVALSVARSQMDSLGVIWTQRPSSDSLAIGYASPAEPFVYQGATIGSSQWAVIGYDSPSIPGSPNMRRAIVTVRFTTGALTDSLQLDRLFPLP